MNATDARAGSASAAERELRRCTKCGKLEDVTKGFSRDPTGPAGRRLVCRDCVREYNEAQAEVRAARKRAGSASTLALPRGPKPREVPPPEPAPACPSDAALRIAVQALEVVATGRRDRVDCGRPELGPAGLSDVARGALDEIELLEQHRRA